MNLDATEANFRDFQETQKLLREELERLAEMTRRYPVVCTFSDFRFVFESRQDIVDLIDKIDEALSAYAADAA